MRTETGSMIMLIVGAVVVALTVFFPGALSVSPKSLGALGVPSNGGIGALQTEGAGWAILGIAIGAALAIGLAAIGGGVGMGTASAAALGAITEKPEIFGKSILYVVFIEAVAIYGFVIAFMLVGYIPSLLG